MANFCSNCGEKVESSWNACPKCGTRLDGDEISQPMQKPMQQAYQRPSPQYYQARHGTNNGTLALIFGIIGICCCGIIFGPLAIYYGNRGTREDSDKTMAQIGLVLGVIGLICGCCQILYLLVILLY